MSDDLRLGAVERLIALCVQLHRVRARAAAGDGAAQDAAGSGAPQAPAGHQPAAGADRPLGAGWSRA